MGFYKFLLVCHMANWHEYQIRVCLLINYTLAFTLLFATMDKRGQISLNHEISNQVKYRKNVEFSGECVIAVNHMHTF